MNHTKEIDTPTLQAWLENGRSIEVIDIRPRADYEAWHIPGSVNGFLADKKLLIIDRDSKYTAAFRSLLSDAGVEPVLEHSGSAPGAQQSRDRAGAQDG